jgi:hypothetical protein
MFLKSKFHAIFKIVITLTLNSIGEFLQLHLLYYEGLTNYNCNIRKVYFFRIVTVAYCLCKHFHAGFNLKEQLMIYTTWPGEFCPELPV